MNKTYHYSIYNGETSEGFQTIEECVIACKQACKESGVNYDDREVRLYLTDDFGETYEECTEEGELVG